MDEPYGNAVTSKWRPRARTRWMWGLQLALAMLFGLATALPAAPRSAHADWDEETAAFLVILNNYRVSRGLVPVVVDSRLQQTAEWHAQNQVKDAGCLNLFAGGPSCSYTDTLGRSPSARGQSFGYLNAVAENMNFPTTSAQVSFEGWVESPGHHANMINPTWRAIGIARVCNDVPDCYWVTNYGADLIEPFQAPTFPLPTASWTGTWNIDGRTVVLTQNGDKVTGTFTTPIPRGRNFESGNPGKIEGTLLAGTAKLLGTWTQPDGFSDERAKGGTIEFTMALDGNGFNGRFSYPSPDREGFTRSHNVAGARGQAAPPQTAVQQPVVTQPANNQPGQQAPTQPANTQPAQPTAPQQPANTQPAQPPAATQGNNAWTVMPGLAIDISIGANGAIWVIGTNAAPHRWNGTGWDWHPGVARQIAVAPDGSPWVVNEAGEVFQGPPVNGVWQQRPAFTTEDIAIGLDGSVWIAERGGFRLSAKWNGQEFEDKAFDAAKIAVDRDGIPWMVGAGNDLFSGPHDDNALHWRPGTALDISSGADGSLWSIGTDGAPYRWNGNDWDKRPGEGLVQVAIEPNGTVWAINTQQQILRWSGNVAETRP